MATIADELNAISVEHGYTGAAPKTIAGAIDALADTLAGTDVEGKRTIAGAVKALAPYIGGGGGALGEPQDVPFTINYQPYVGATFNDDTPLDVVEMRVGSQVVFSTSGDVAVVSYVAAGVTIVAQAVRASAVDTYLVTVDFNNNVFETVEAFDLDVSVDSSRNVISFVMPEWNFEENQFPLMHIRNAI